jgi:hypothetical protein
MSPHLRYGSAVRRVEAALRDLLLQNEVIIKLKAGAGFTRDVGQGDDRDRW